MSTYQLVRSRNGEDERPRVETVVELLEPEEHDVIRIGRDGVVDVPPARQRDKDLLSALALIAQAGLRQKRYDVGLCPKHWREVFPEVGGEG